MMFIEIKEDKFDKMAEYTEKMLKYGGKLMSCLSEVGEEYGMSFREGGSMGQRYGERSNQGGGRYSNRGGMNYRDDDEEDMDERYGEMEERRGRRRRSNGRYY